jgi:hypothetical protein
MMEINVNDNTLQISIVDKSMGSGDDDVVEITVSSTEIGSGMMPWRAN